MFKTEKQKDIFIGIYTVVWICINFITDYVFGSGAFLISNVVMFSILLVIALINNRRVKFWKKS